MIEKIKKLRRSVARARNGNDDEDGAVNEEYSFALIGFMLSPIAGGIAMGWVGAGVAAIVAPVLCFYGTHVLKLNSAMMREVIKDKINEDVEGVGGKRHVNHLKWTQKCVTKLTVEFRNAAHLPPKVEKEVQRYLRDAAEFAAHVRVYDSKGSEKDEIVFTREVFNAQGQHTWIPVGAVKTAMGLAVQQPAPVAMPQTPQAIKALKPIQYIKGP